MINFALYYIQGALCLYVNTVLNVNVNCKNGEVLCNVLYVLSVLLWKLGVVLTIYLYRVNYLLYGFFLAYHTFEPKHAHFDLPNRGVKCVYGGVKSVHMKLC